MKYLQQFIQEHKLKTIITLLLLLGQSIGTLLIPFLVADIIDQGILKNDTQTIMYIGGWMVLVSLLAAAVAIWGSWCSADLAALFGHDMRNKVFAQSQQISIRQLEAVGIPSMINRTTVDIAHLQSNIGLFLQLVVPAPIIAVVSIVMTLRANIYLALVLLLSVVLFIAALYLILRKSSPLAAQIQSKLDTVGRIVREHVSGTRVVRAFGNEQYEEYRSGVAMESYADNMIKLNKIFAWLNPSAWLIVGLCIAAVVWVGGILSGYREIQIGVITAVSEYTIITLAYLVIAAATITTLPKTISCLERLQQVLDLQPEINDNPDTNHTLPLHKIRAVSFEQVCFAYPGAEEYVLHNISFSCQSGQTTAIIGSTGSGKSTISNLMLRFYDIQNGCIKYEFNSDNNKPVSADIRTLPQQQLRTAIGMVPQKSFLFSGTIADNLRMGQPHATDEQLWEALRIAQAEDFVAKLPLQLAAPVSQGGKNFSGGQKQRLAIARALVKDSPLYIFDDSLSALDVKTDLALRQALQNYRQQAIKIIVTQRVSTAMNADNILVLDKGIVVGQGTHTELLANCLVYQEIVHSQLQAKEVC